MFIAEGGLEKLSRREYWQVKYKEQTETFDWFVSDDAIPGLACHCLFNVAAKKDFSKTPDAMHARIEPVNVLDLGCGQSVLPLRFYEWTPFPVGVHCLDYVEEAVDFQLQTLKATWPGHRQSYVSGVCASVCSLPYKSNLFHVVTDKGTMDALLKDPVSGSTKAKEMLSEVERVLRKDGLFMQITDEDPDSRMYFLETHSPSTCQWRFSILTDSNQCDREIFAYTFCK